MKRGVLIAVLVAIAVGAVVFRARVRDMYIEWSKPVVPSEQPRVTASAKPANPGVTRTPKPAVTPKQSSSVTPNISPTVSTSGAINLAVPFSSQAPRGNWSLPWQEACEETSVILVGSFLTDEQPTMEEMEERILAAVAWQQDYFGYYKHTTAAQTAQMAKALYGFTRVDVEYDVGTDAIAKHVRAGRPVIVPLAGRLLGNPYYTQPGPVYHMLVVKGIAENGDIITNDVGTRFGRNLTYSPSVFENAMHDTPSGGDDWPDGVDPVPYIESGRSAIIVIYPN